MTVTKHVTYCRICPATCGLVVDVEDNRVVRAIGDVDNPLTRGFSCPKGRHIGDFLAAPDRFQTSLRRTADGDYEPIDAITAVEEIASKLKDIVAQHGPDSVALFGGTQAAFTTITRPFVDQFWAGIGSRKTFSTMTIDQSAMWVADGRQGQWSAGSQRFEDSDVWMLVGTNPVVSMQGGAFTGFPIHDGLRRLIDAKRDGMKFIVVDPRRTEVAAHADVHLQLIPGTDSFLFGGLVHILLRDSYQDDEFIARWVNGIDELRAAVQPLAPDVTAGICGVPVEDLEEAARIFGSAKKGMALAGTGPDMGPWSNLAEHMVRLLNVVCGRYPRPGDALSGYNVLGSSKTLPAMAIGPNRTWDRDYQSRLGYGLLYGQLPTASLPDEILQPGDDRVRALLVSAGNPGSAIPDQARAMKALGALDLLVTIDPYPTETARMADYVIAPKMHLERPDSTRGFEAMFEGPFAQYTPAIVEAPPGTMDDWEFWLRMSWAFGRTVNVAGRDYAPGDLPTAQAIVESLSTRGKISLDELKQHPHGVMVPAATPPVAGPPLEGRDDGRFEVMPPDVAAELAAAIGDVEADIAKRPFRLISRRKKETINSLGRRVPSLTRRELNPCFAHPDDLAALGLESGQLVQLESDFGTVLAVVEPDATMRRGALSMTHGFGGIPGEQDDPRVYGTNPGRLLSVDADVQTINRMPRMSSIPVTMTPAD
jgi:anaerobic selenocysteine-containing dehydrogenase